MTGSGGPGPAAERAVAARLDPRLLEQQVLVAAFADAAPEVHIVCADPARRALVFCDASVGGSGEVDVGSERLVPLADVGSVIETADLGIRVMSQSGSLLVQIFFEEAEPHRVWTEALSSILDVSKSANGATSEAATGASDEQDEVHMLQARSRQLQNKIGSLEAINQRRDAQLDKMVGRLEGAMEMLAAVQDMCNQQRNVIVAQKVSIESLQKDLGLSTEDLGMSNGMAAPAGEAASDDDADDDSDEPQEGAENNGGEAEMLAQGEKMMALLAQAEQMEKMLRMLEAGVGEESESSQSPPQGGSPAGKAAARPQQIQEDSDDESEEEEEADPDSEEAAVERLRNLEAEKRRFEGLLANSQNEHQDLLGKLQSMQSLMSALGIDPGDLDGNSDDEMPQN